MTFQKGNKLGRKNKGLKHTEEAKKKMSEGHEGLKHSEETKQKISLTHTGEKVFTGFKTSYDRSVRDSKQYHEWRKSVFKRDCYTCQICGKTGVYLHPHHIKWFSKYPKLRFKIKNGISLCEKHHRQLHMNKGYTMIVDIDNTIFRTKGIDYGKSIPIKKRIRHFNKLYDIGVKIIYWTSRGVGSGIDYRKLTEQQFKEFNVKYTQLRLDKPIYDMWIDDKAINIKEYVKLWR